MEGDEEDGYDDDTNNHSGVDTTLGIQEDCNHNIDSFYQIKMGRTFIISEIVFKKCSVIDSSVLHAVCLTSKNAPKVLRTKYRSNLTSPDM